MATLTTTKKHCDVFGTTKDVRTFQVVIYEGDRLKDADNLNEFGSWKADLSPRGLERLKKFIGRGITKPNGKDGDSASE